MGLATTAVFAVLLIALPLLALLGSGLSALRQTADQAGAERALGIVRLETQIYEQTLAETRTLLTAMAALPQLRPGADSRTCNALLGDLLEARPGLANLGVVNTDGTLRCSALPFRSGLDVSHRGWFRAAMESDDLVAGDYQVGLITGVASTNLAYAVTGSDGTRNGVVFAAVSADWLTEKIQSAALPAGATAALLDSGLRLIASHPAPAAPARHGERPAWDPAFTQALGADARAGTFEARGLDGTQRVYAYVAPQASLPLAKPHWVIVGLPLAALRGPYEAIIQRQFGQLAIALGVLLVLAGGISHFDAVRPARRLARVAQRVAAGDTTARAGDPGGAREFLELAQGFDAAAQRATALLAALRLLSGGNRVLLRGDTEPALLEAMCRVAVEAGGYRSAQVVYRHGDGMQLQALAGDEGGFLRSLEMHWNDARAGETPTPGAIFGARTMVLNDTLTSAVPALNQAAVRTGMRAAIGLPLRVEGKVIGAFTIYAAQPGVFGAQEVEILEEMADDLAFGITTARLRERHLEADTRLQQLLYHDQVTGLPNRRRFLEEFAHWPAPPTGQAVLLVVYLGNYWDVAAALGPAQGDALLQAVAERLHGLRPALLARIAQAEFALLLADGDAAHPAQDVLARLNRPFPLPPIQVDLEASVGVAPIGQPAAPTPEHLLQAARLAAREARHDPARWRPADRDLEQQWTERLALAGELRAALGGPEFTLHVQPLLDLHSGTICAVEALARWQHPRRGAIPPARFIGIAESTGLIGPLTWQVLELARELGSRYAAAGLELPIAVNISAQNLHDAELIPRLRALLDGWSLPPGRLHIEITETALMADPTLSRRALQALRELGLPVYLDDFGTGYSSLAYLRELPLSGIKLDRAFIAALHEPATQRIVRAMCELADALGLTVIAEGLEDPDQLALLEKLGCHAVQGYAIARPMPGEALTDWLRGFRAPARRH